MRTFVNRTVTATLLAGAMLAAGACASQEVNSAGDPGGASPAMSSEAPQTVITTPEGQKALPKPATTYERWGLRGMDPSFEQGPGPEGTDLDSIQE